MLRHISLFTSNLPDGVKKRKLGGLSGDVGGGGPRSVKCHSWRLESETGAAWKAGEGLGEEEDSSAVSRRRRRIVGGGAMGGQGGRLCREARTERKIVKYPELTCGSEGEWRNLGRMRRGVSRRVSECSPR